MWKDLYSKRIRQKKFDNLVYVSCDRNESLHAIYSSDFDPTRIIRGLSALTGGDIIPGKTLTFLDEVQAFPQALEALKYFCEKVRIYVNSGSFLAFFKRMIWKFVFLFIFHCHSEV